VVGEVKTLLQGDTPLPTLNLFIVEFFDPATLYTHQMIMMIVRRKLENRVAPFKMMTNHKSGGLKLGKYPVDSRQTNFVSILEQELIHILSAQVMNL